MKVTKGQVFENRLYQQRYIKVVGIFMGLVHFREVHSHNYRAIMGQPTKTMELEKFELNYYPVLSKEERKAKKYNLFANLALTFRKRAGLEPNDIDLEDNMENYLNDYLSYRGTVDMITYVNDIVTAHIEKYDLTDLTS